MTMFHIYWRFVYAPRRQSSRPANNFYPSSSITRYRPAASGNNSVTPKSPCAKKRAGSFYPPPPPPGLDKKIEFREIECLQIQSLTNENCQQQSALKLFFPRLHDSLADGQIHSDAWIYRSYIYFPTVVFVLSYLTVFSSTIIFVLTFLNVILPEIRLKVSSG